MSTLLLALLITPALAADEKKKDKDDDEFEAPEEALDENVFDEDEEEDSEPTPTRRDEGDSDIPMDDPKDDEIQAVPDSEGGDLDFDDELEDGGEDVIGGEGVDNAKIYRDYVETMDDLGAEEELLAWERYLDKYPNTLFRDRIDKRIEELSQSLYGERIDDPNANYEDAKDREIEFAHPMLLENIDPRTRARVGLEIGFPSYVAAMADFEYQILRPLSVHAGVRSRYTGPNLEIGGKYAIVKSARTNTLVTGVMDLHVNAVPGFFGVRPQLAAGHRFDVGSGLDVMAMGGVDMELGRSGPFSMRTIGGFHAAYYASDVVTVYAEGSVNMKGTGSDKSTLQDPFAFNVVTFGVKFNPAFGAQGSERPAFVGLSANVPAQYNYWGYHVGAVMVDMNYYMDDKSYWRNQ